MSTRKPPTSDPAAQLQRSMALLWQEPDQPSRGPKPALTLAQIVDAAIEVADAEGVEGLSMRGVARRLGVGTMSLYRYVPSKAILLNLMLDQVSRPSLEQLRTAGADWRTVLTAAARDGYQLYLNHPWLLRINWSRPVLGPNSLAGVEIVIAGLARLGLTSQERINVVVSIDALVTGLARNQILYANVEAETGISDDEFWKMQYPALVEAMNTGDYPAMAALDEDAFNSGWEETLDFGLQLLLDGLARLIDSRRAPDGGGG